jgi:hypothetical protein
MSKQNHKLYGWLFRYNSYTKEWYAARRDDSHLLFSDLKNKKIIKNPSIRELLKVVQDVKGDQ